MGEFSATADTPDDVRWVRTFTAMFGVSTALQLLPAAILLAIVAGWQPPLPVTLTLCALGLLTSAAIGTAVRVLGKAGWKARTKAIEGALDSHRQIEELFAMTDMLQAAETYDDASAVLMATAQRLLPDFGTALYVFNNSRDRLDLARAWDLPESYVAPDALSPSNCWALKRGKPHINDPGANTLLCAHHCGDTPTVEIPMMASGQLHGLLILTHAPGETAFTELKDIRRLGRALADSMSLALSNIGLRDKLRTQSLRDPLTGLYNRRYMEDALERFVSLGSRGGKSTAVIMLDLDDFKRLNDEHGHARGDAVLRDVAGQLVSHLRPTDVVCRHGGEELLAILPDCDLTQAALKAEQLRKRIEGLSEVHKFTVSASFGVAAVPEAAISAADLLPIADAALYQAKLAGKNCVAMADRRANVGEASAPRLAATR